MVFLCLQWSISKHQDYNDLNESLLKSQRSIISFLLSKLYGIGFVPATSIALPVTVFFSHGQASVNSAVHTCNTINANFDGTCNVIHHMVLVARKSNNEAYTFREILKENEAGKFIQAMKKKRRSISVWMIGM